jgi:hypothetical protein
LSTVFGYRRCTLTCRESGKVMFLKVTA